MKHQFKALIHSMFPNVITVLTFNITHIDKRLDSEEIPKRFTLIIFLLAWMNAVLPRCITLVMTVSHMTVFLVFKVNRNVVLLWVVEGFSVVVKHILAKGNFVFYKGICCSFVWGEKMVWVLMPLSLLSSWTTFSTDGATLVHFPSFLFHEISHQCFI